MSANVITTCHWQWTQCKRIRSSFEFENVNGVPRNVHSILKYFVTDSVVDVSIQVDDLEWKHLRIPIGRFREKAPLPICSCQTARYSRSERLLVYLTVWVSTNLRLPSPLTLRVRLITLLQGSPSNDLGIQLKMGIITYKVNRAVSLFLTLLKIYWWWNTWKFWKKLKFLYPFWYRCSCFQVLNCFFGNTTGSVTINLQELPAEQQAVV